MGKLELALDRRDASGHSAGQGTTKRGIQSPDAHCGASPLEACWLGRQKGKKSLALKVFLNQHTQQSQKSAKLNSTYLVLFSLT
jgi:hypothetical protein